MRKSLAAAVAVAVSTSGLALMSGPSYAADEAPVSTPSSAADADDTATPSAGDQTTPPVPSGSPGAEDDEAGQSSGAGADAPSPSAEGTAPEPEDSDAVPTGYLTAAPRTFYPTVRDGFRDGVHLELWSDVMYDESGDVVPQSWDVTVRGPRGGVVAERSGSNPEDHAYWYWNGKDGSGRPVRVGTYQATATFTNENTGEFSTQQVSLTAKSDTVNRRLTKTRTGVATSSRWHRGNFHMTRDGWFDGPTSLYLDSWGGRGGVRYAFTIPRDARNIRWSVNGSHGFGWGGRIFKRGHRVSSTRYRVSVTVTGWEAYSVKRANLTYTTTVRR